MRFLRVTHTLVRTSAASTTGIAPASLACVRGCDREPMEPGSLRRHPGHMRRIPIVVAVLWLSVGCGGAAAAVDVAGTWAETGGGEHGHMLEFDGKSKRFLLHGPGPGGHNNHDHFEGSYRVEGSAVVLTGAWESNQKAEVVRAAIDGGTLRLDLGQDCAVGEEAVSQW